MTEQDERDIIAFLRALTEVQTDSGNCQIAAVALAFVCACMSVGLWATGGQFARRPTHCTCMPTVRTPIRCG